MITSQKKWIYDIFPKVFLLFSIIFFLFIFKVNYSKNTKLPIEGSGFFMLIISLCASISILLILFSKKIVFDENNITIKFVFLRKDYNYDNEEIAGWREIFDVDSFGQYKTFYFKTVNEKIFMMSNREFKNYNQMVSEISIKSPEIEISRFHNFPLLLKTFVLTFIILSTIFYISYLNKGC